jgi:hypothetical protein
LAGVLAAAIGRAARIGPRREVTRRRSDLHEAGDPVDVDHGIADERRDGEVTVAGDARRSGAGGGVRQLPMDCPYCWERMEDAPRGRVCRRCRSTVGAELGAELREESLR